MAIHLPGLPFHIGDRKLFTRTRRGVTADVYVGFANAVDRDNWYHMVVEMQIGRKLSLGEGKGGRRKGRGVYRQILGGKYT